MIKEMILVDSFFYGHDCSDLMLYFFNRETENYMEAVKKKKMYFDRDFTASAELHSLR